MRRNDPTKGGQGHFECRLVGAIVTAENFEVFDSVRIRENSQSWRTEFFINLGENGLFCCLQ